MSQIYHKNFDYTKPKKRKRRRLKKIYRYLFSIILITWILIIGVNVFQKFNKEETTNKETTNNKEETIKKNKTSSFQDSLTKEKNYQKENLKKYLDLHKKDKELKSDLVVYLVNNKITYSPNIKELSNCKYFILDNLDRYLKNGNDCNVIGIVNANADKKAYVDVQKTDISKNELMLVNKYNYLTDKYNPSDLVKLSTKYNLGTNNEMRKVAYDAFVKMSDAASKENISIRNASGYRSYKYQVNLYNNYVARDGKSDADTYSARPGYSEHQTGYVSDINVIDSSFENTDAFRWLSNNSYKYGFILRFPKGKEKITGYEYEPWHYRYVGIKAAKIIHDEDITLEEYYAYYVKK